MADAPVSDTDDPEALFRQAVQRHQSGDVEAALALYARVVQLSPRHAGAHGNIGVALRRLGRPEDALASFDRALAIRTDNADTHCSRGNVLFDLKRIEESLAAFDRAIAVRPDYANAHYGRGTALAYLERPAEALTSYDRAIDLNANFAKALRNRGVLHRRAGRPDAALADFDRAIAAGEIEEAYWYRSFCRLLKGQFAGGWADYEHRWNVEAFIKESPGQTTPELRARFDPRVEVRDLAGARVLLVGEQGVGDVLMFASIVPDLAATAASVSLVCDPRLWRLFSNSLPDVNLVEPAAAAAGITDFDRVLAIGSLGRLYRNRLEDFPAKPYLSATPGAQERWAARLGPTQGRRRVGLSWRGGLVRTGREARSLALAELRPVLDLPNCEFVSLQYGNHGEEVAAVSAELGREIRLFPPEEIDDFDELAGLVQNLDVVVSVQTSIVHLCGGLGAPCLVMVPSVPEWRYTDASPTMPWYGSVSLFRRAGEGDWSPVVRRVADAVAQRLDLTA